MWKVTVLNVSTIGTCLLANGTIWLSQSDYSRLTLLLDPHKMGHVGHLWWAEQSCSSNPHKEEGVTVTWIQRIRKTDCHMAPTSLLTSYVAPDESLNLSGSVCSSVKWENGTMYSLKSLADLDSSQRGHKNYLNGQKKNGCQSNPGEWKTFLITFSTE